MSNKVTFDYSKVAPFVSGHEVVSMKKLAQDAKKVLVEKTGDGNMMPIHVYILAQPPHGCVNNL